MKALSRALLLLLCAGLAACSPLVYAPTPQFAPLLQEAGDVRADVLIGAGLNGGEGIDLAVQAAYAPLRHVFIHGTLQQSLRSKQLQSFGEGGAGIWVPLTRRITGEVLTGYGVGRVRAENMLPSARYTTDVEMRGTITRVFVQANLARFTTLHPRVVPAPVPGHLGLALRLSHVRGHDFEWNLLGAPEPLHGTYFEPAVFVEMGEGPLRFDAQIGISRPLYQTSFDYDWQYVYGSAGMSIDVTALLRR